MTAAVGPLVLRPVVLSRPDEQASLVLRHRYAATISSALMAINDMPHTFGVSVI